VPGSRLYLTPECVTQYDSFGNLLHRPSHLLTLSLQFLVSFLFRYPQVRLQDPLGSFHQSAGLDFLGKFNVLFFQSRHFDFCSGEIADGRDQSDLSLAEFVRDATLEVNNPHWLSPTYQGQGQESLISVFGYFVEKPEPRIEPCPFSNYGEFFMLGPYGHARSSFELETINDSWMRVLGCREDQFTVLKNVK